MVLRQEILDFCDKELSCADFHDYAPNGLQVEGRAEIGKIVCAVTAGRAAIDFAAAEGADLLLVHHGMFWKNEPAAVTGWKKERIARLLRRDINLAGYHLPLDAHPVLGNNAQLAQKMGWRHTASFGEQNLLNRGTTAPATAAELAAQLERTLRRPPVLLGSPECVIENIVWCSGGAQNYFQAAIDAGADAYITGEMSEAQYHLAQESGVCFFAAGHHATERYGVQALAARIGEKFGIPFVFFDEENPV